MNPEEMKKWIDGASYKQLLSRWRFASAGDPFFMGEMGEYYQRKMAEKEVEVGQEGHVRASKSIGWEK